MTILGIETSCDETGAALVRQDKTGALHIFASMLASSLALHAQTGGIIPETAAREQVKYILPVIQQTIKTTAWSAIDAIAVTYGPGLIGSLLVGVETAKTLAFVLKKPLIPVNHLYGHIYANWLRDNAKSIAFPALALVVSGGHTDLVLMKSHKNIKAIGGTRDDAAGEAFDKIGRLLNLPYPAGPTIASLAEKGNPKAYKFPRPMHDSGDFDFSFSGLKTAVLREIKESKTLSSETIANLCASTEQAVVDILVKKTITAAKQFGVKSLLLGGGVAANEKLRKQLEYSMQNALPSAKLFFPEKSLCTDNAAMIAAAGFFAKAVPFEKITANPELYY